MLNFLISPVTKKKPCEFLQIEELACMLSFDSRSSSLDSLSSLDSAPGTPVRGSPIPRRASPIHSHFYHSAKKNLLLWVRRQCQKCVSAPQFTQFYSKRIKLAFTSCFFLPVYSDRHYILLLPESALQSV